MDVGLAGDYALPYFEQTCMGEGPGSTSPPPRILHVWPFSLYCPIPLQPSTILATATAVSLSKRLHLPLVGSAWPSHLSQQKSYIYIICKVYLVFLTHSNSAHIYPGDVLERQV